MSASGGGSGLSQRVSDLFDRAGRADSLADIMVNGIGAILFAFAAILIEGSFTVAEIIILPAAALGEALADLAIALFGSPARIIIAGAQATAQSLVGQFNVGPLTFALGVGAVLLALYLIQAFRSEEETANIIIGSGIDIPTPGFEGPEEENNE